MVLGLGKAKKKQLEMFKKLKDGVDEDALQRNTDSLIALFDDIVEGKEEHEQLLLAFTTCWSIMSGFEKKEEKYALLMGLQHFLKKTGGE